MEYDLKYWFLHSHSLFNKVDAELLDEIYSGCDYRSLKRDAFIFDAQNVIRKIYIVNTGRIKTSYSITKNEEVVSEILKEGDVFGALTLEEGDNVNCEFAQVLSDDASYCSFELPVFKSILSKNAELALSYSHLLGEKLKIVTGKYRDVALKNVKERVINFFMLHAQYEAKWTGNKAEINMYCTHRDIANFTAASRQTVSGIINELEKEEKIIYVGRNKLIIPDITKLKN